MRASENVQLSRVDSIAHRMTSQRRAVLNVLQETLDHPTADEIFHRVRHNMSRVSLATVYRNLDVLVAQNLVKLIESPGYARRYDIVTEHHYHIRCVECGMVDDVELSRLPDFSALVTRSGSFEVLSTRLEFEGRCGLCCEKQN
jgi:Fe2+ or Zn2+ uptake regulation protein